MKRLHLIISGDVIGVGYRSWVVRQAQNLHLTGWVKNRPDRAVEILAEGSEESLKALLGACKHGPDVAWVERVDDAWQKATNEFVNFSVIY